MRMLKSLQQTQPSNCTAGSQTANISIRMTKTMIDLQFKRDLQIQMFKKKMNIMHKVVVGKKINIMQIWATCERSGFPTHIKSSCSRILDTTLLNWFTLLKDTLIHIHFILHYFSCLIKDMVSTLKHILWNNKKKVLQCVSFKPCR